MNVLHAFFLQVQDSLPFSIGISTDKGPVCTLSNSTLFPRGSLIPNMKILKLSRTRMFPLEAYFADQNEVPSCISPKITNFMVKVISLCPLHILLVDSSLAKVYEDIQCTRIVLGLFLFHCNC